MGSQCSNLFYAWSYHDINTKATLEGATIGSTSGYWSNHITLSAYAKGSFSSKLMTAKLDT
jgi:hypothetical protein